MEQKFNTSLLTGFGPSKLIADLSFEEMTPGFDCGGGTYKITSGEVEIFKKLMGDTNAYPADVVPVGMIYIFGLRICWDRKVFIDGAIRAGDKIAFYQPAKVDDTITTKLSIADKKEVTKDDKVWPRTPTAPTTAPTTAPITAVTTHSLTSFIRSG